MFELAKSEFMRYQKWAFLVAILLLGVFGFISKLKPLLEANQGQSALVNLTFLGGSLLFGILQMVLYRRKNYWTYLIHRPLSVSKIYLSLCAAAVVLIFIALGLPWLIAMLSIDVFSQTVVESRHYLHILFLLLASVMCYLIGSLIVLNPSLAIAALLGLIVFVLAPMAKNTFVQFIPVVVFVSLLLFLNIKSFKPDLSQYLTKPLHLVLLAVPISFSLLYVLTASVTTVVYHVPKFIAGTHPDNNPTANSFRYLWEYTETDMPEYILAETDTLQAKAMIQQAKLAKYDWFNTSIERFPRQGQLYVDDHQYALSHRKTNSNWQFSHQDMVLIGTSSTTGKLLGVLGKQGFITDVDNITVKDKFTQVPFLLGEQFLLTPNTLYQVNFNDKVLSEKFVLAHGEEFVTLPKRHDNFISIATNQHILMFDPRQYRDEYQTLQPDYKLPHPVALDSLYAVRAYELADGYLITYFGPDHFGYDRPGAQAYHAKLSGKVEYMGGREFTVYSHPAWIREALYVMSPVLWAAQNLMFHSIDPQVGNSKPWAELRELNIAEQATIVALALHLFSFVGAVLLAIRHRWSAPQIATWVSLCAILSLPALVACFFLNPLKVEKKPQLQKA